MTTPAAPHILLVEDDEAIAATIVYALERDHCRVTHCTTGLAALPVWQDAAVAAAILDVGLPDQSGFALFRQLKASHPQRPVMFLTAQNDEIDRVVGFELGADDYLGKPFSPRELVLRVKAILRRQRPDDGSAAAVAANTDGESHIWLQHDPLRMVMTCRGQVLSLTRSEYRLLAALLNAPGRVFSRDQLLDALGDSPSGDRAIDTHIKALRAKLRAVAEGWDPIVTHRGLGYSLAEKPPFPAKRFPEKDFLENTFPKKTAPANRSGKHAVSGHGEPAP